MSPEYLDAQAARDHALLTMSTIADANGWTAADQEQAEADIEAAYDGATGIVASYFSWVDFGQFDLVTGTSADEAQATEFWTDLYQRAQSSWALFPNGAKAIAWLAAASGTAAAARVEEEENTGLVGQAGGFVADSAGDLRAIGETAGKIGSSPATWYGLAAAAALGALLWFRR